MSHIRAIFAVTVLLMKKQLGQRGLKLAYEILKPCMLLAIMVPLWGFVARSAPFGLPFSAFLATGLLPLVFYRSGAKTMMGMRGQFAKFVQIPAVTELHVALAIVFRDAAVNIMIFLFMIGAMMAAGLVSGPDRIAPLVFLVPVFMVFNLGHGLVNLAMALAIPKIWNIVFATMNRPLLIISGVIYANETLPYGLAQAFSYMPSAQFIMWMRDAYFREYTSTNLSYSYMAQFTIILLLPGLVLVRVFRTKLRRLK